jgi:hypothetical protein
MEDKKRDERLSAVRDALFLLDSDKKERRTTIFLEEFYTMLLRHSEHHGFTFQPDLLDQVINALTFCRKNNHTICFTEIGTVLYSLSIFAPQEVDYWMLGIADMLWLDSGKPSGYPLSSAQVGSVPYAKILAGYILGLFKTLDASRICYSFNKETPKNFSEIFANVITRIIIFGGRYYLTGRDLYSNRDNPLLDLKKFQSCLSELIKSLVKECTGYQKVVQALYRTALNDLPVEKHQPEELGKILYYEMLHALLGSLEPNELQAWLFPKTPKTE